LEGGITWEIKIGRVKVSQEDLSDCEKTVGDLHPTKGNQWARNWEVLRARKRERRGQNKHF